MGKRLQLSITATVPDNIIEQSSIFAKIKEPYDALQLALKTALTEAGGDASIETEARVIAPPKAPRQRKPRVAAAQAAANSGESKEEGKVEGDRAPSRLRARA